MPRHTNPNPITPYLTAINDHFYNKSISEDELINKLDTMIKSYTDNPGPKSVYSFTTKTYEYLRADKVQNKLTAYLNMSFEIVRDIRICNYEEIDQAELHAVYKNFIAALLDVHGTQRNKVDVQFYLKCTELDIKLVNTRITIQKDAIKTIKSVAKDGKSDSFTKEFEKRFEIETDARMNIYNLERTHMYEIQYLIKEHLGELK